MAEAETSNISYDAQRLTEEIEAGEQSEPKVNTDRDYERSKAYAVSEAESQNSKAEEAKLEGEQAKFQEMAKEMKPDSDE